MLEFDAGTTKLLEDAYLGSDFARRRRASFDAVQPRPNDRIADIGCGNGLLTLDLARAVGEAGRVFGVDPSDDMRRAASQRCADCTNVEILNGTANDVPIETGTIDKAVSLQVFEYLHDLHGALAEAHRVLKSDGRLAVGDMHWDTIAWFSNEPERMRKMIEAWDRHLVERCIPAMLPPAMQDGGFIVEQVTPIPFCDKDLRPDGLPNMMIHLMERYVVENKLISAEMAHEWAEEQRTLAGFGRFFFSLTHFVIVARKR